MCLLCETKARMEHYISNDVFNGKQAALDLATMYIATAGKAGTLEQFMDACGEAIVQAAKDLQKATLIQPTHPAPDAHQ